VPVRVSLPPGLLGRADLECGGGESKVDIDGVARVPVPVEEADETDGVFDFVGDDGLLP
jgi:hypothetical protein